MQDYTLNHGEDIMLLQYKSLSLSRYMYITEEQFLLLASSIVIPVTVI
jgi:hypothetical protein